MYVKVSCWKAPCRNKESTDYLEICDASLLDEIDIGNLPNMLNIYKDRWWTKIKRAHKFCMYDKVVFGDGLGGCISTAQYTNCDYAVRPVLHITTKFSGGFSVGDVFTFGGKQFYIMSETRAFCLDGIGNHCFREDWTVDNANDYEKSDVKRFIDGWFATSMRAHVHNMCRNNRCSEENSKLSNRSHTAISDMRKVRDDLHNEVSDVEYKKFLECSLLTTLIELRETSKRIELNSSFCKGCCRQNCSCCCKRG